MRKARTWLVLFVVLAMAFSLFAVAGCGGGGNEPAAEEPAGEGTETASGDYKLITPGKLTIGSDLDFPPMEQLNGSTPEGFDVELMQAIAKEMGLEAEYLPPQKFDTLLASVNAGKFDVVASSLTINDERKKEVVFSDPYFDSNQSIAMKAGSTYTKPEDMSGKKIGVQSGTTGEQWATENLKPKGATIVPFSKTTEAFSGLEAGNVDAVVNDLPITADYVKKSAGKLAIVNSIPTGEQYGFAVAMENKALADAINEALKKVRDSGEYDKIYEKWIGQQQ